MAKSVLFLCVANSARSQMAEGLARAMVPEGVVVASAGSVPSRVHPVAVQAMQEIGVDISAHKSTPVVAVDPTGVGVVITLCADEVCPAFLGDAHRLHWPMFDPASAEEGSLLESFRAVRDQIQSLLKAELPDILMHL
ncbi:arsenate reductase ArsC [Planctomycetota bacterium]|nr:arsenate reductase ArsC [Planctomycetota bacterium]